MNVPEDKTAHFHVTKFNSNMVTQGYVTYPMLFDIYIYIYIYISSDH